MEIRKIFFDMDGVLADFEGGVQRFCNMKSIPQEVRDCEEEQKMWEGIRDAVHFYDMLEILPGAKEMFDTIYSIYGDRCEILTGIPRPYRGIVNAREDKIKWIRRLFSEEIKINVVLREEKVQFVTGENDILIDDYFENINDWKSYGGTGILHTDPEKTLHILDMIENS